MCCIALHGEAQGLVCVRYAWEGCIAFGRSREVCGHNGMIKDKVAWNWCASDTVC